MFKQIRKTIVFILLASFVGSSIQAPVYAQMAQLPWMPKPGVRVGLSPDFTPAQLKGITIHPENPLMFDFIIYKGDKVLSGDQKKEEYKKLIKYFLASLAIPDEDQWVNLSPYEKNRIIKDDFGKTLMGRDLLAQDYILKQITASLIYPEDNLGKKFWDKVYAKAQQQYGTTNIPVNTFNKVWILPDDALIYEKGNTAYVLKNHLKVMLEEDYLSLEKHSEISTVIPAKAGIQNKNNINTIGSQVIRELVLPALEKEVNEGKNFAMLRQVYSGMLLATWFKRTLRKSILGQIYADKTKLKGVDQDPKNNEAIYQRYLQAYKKGVFNYIKEDADKYTNEIIPRKYFSGGTLSYAMMTQLAGKDIDITHSLDLAERSSIEGELPAEDLATVAMDRAMNTNDHLMSASDQEDPSLYKKHLKRAQALIAHKTFRFDQVPINEILSANPRAPGDLHGLMSVFKQHVQSIYHEKLGGIMDRIIRAHTDAPKLFMLHEMVEGELVRVLDRRQLNRQAILSAAHLKATEIEDKAAEGLGYSQVAYNYYRNFLGGDGTVQAHKMVVVFPAHANMEDLGRINQMAKEMEELLMFARTHDIDYTPAARRALVLTTGETVFHYLYFEHNMPDARQELILHACASRASRESAGEKSLSALLTENNFEEVLNRAKNLESHVTDVRETGSLGYIYFDNGKKSKVTLIDRRKLTKERVSAAMTSDKAMLDPQVEERIRGQIAVVLEGIDRYKNARYQEITNTKFKGNSNQIITGPDILDQQIETSREIIANLEENIESRYVSFMPFYNNSDLSVNNLPMTLQGEGEIYSLVREKLGKRINKLSEVTEQELRQVFNEIIDEMAMSDKAGNEREARHRSKALIKAAFPVETKMDGVFEGINKEFLAEAMEELSIFEREIPGLRNRLKMHSVSRIKFEREVPHSSEIQKYLDFIKLIIEDLDLVKEAITPTGLSNIKMLKKFGIYMFYLRLVSHRPGSNLTDMKQKLVSIYEELQNIISPNPENERFHSYVVPDRFGHGSVHFKVQMTKISDRETRVLMIADSGEEWGGAIATEGTMQEQIQGNPVLNGINNLLSSARTSMYEDGLGNRKRHYSKFLDLFEAIGYKHFDKIKDYELAAILKKLDEKTWGILQERMDMKVEPYINERPSAAKTIQDFESGLEDLYLQTNGKVISMRSINGAASCYFTYQDGIEGEDQLQATNDVLKYIVYDGRKLLRGQYFAKEMPKSVLKGLADLDGDIKSRFGLGKESDVLRVNTGNDLRPIEAIQGMVKFVSRFYERQGKDPAQVGGIDLNSANLAMVIKRDGKGVVLPLVQQDLAQLGNIEGLDPVILSIKPASQTALFPEVQQHL